MYERIHVNISDNQKDNIQSAIKNSEPITIRIDPNIKGEDILALTQTQIKKLRKGKPVNITISKSQLKHNMKIEGGFLSLLAGLAARALPMIAKTLGIGALTGLATTATQKVLGEGLYLKRGGNVCQVETDGKGLYLGTVNKNNARELQQHGNGLYLKKGGHIVDGSGLILGDNSPFKNIPILGLLL